MYYKDLDYCGYFDHHIEKYQYGFDKSKILAVGWIDYDKEPKFRDRKISFEIGKADIDFLDKLKSVIKKADNYVDYMGWHTCVLCKNNSEKCSLYGQIFLPYKGKIYVAPKGIVHYIEEHDYLPPNIFIEAIMNCDSILSGEDHLSAIRKIDERFYWFLAWHKSEEKENGKIKEEDMPWHEEHEKVRKEDEAIRQKQYEEENKEYIEAKKKVAKMSKKQLIAGLKSFFTK